MTGRSGSVRLTVRGKAFLACGLACVVCAVALGQRELLRIAALLLALPMLCWLWLFAWRVQLDVARRSAPRIAAGDRVDVELTLRRAAPGGGPPLVQDLTGPGLDQAPVLEPRLRGSRPVRVEYQVAAHRRGRWALGPLTAISSDPFGMAERFSRHGHPEAVLVLPRVQPIRPVPGPGESFGSGHSRRQESAVAAGQALSVREYRPGDDLRRVHWRSTARRGELMVRRDLQSDQRKATLVLDRRPVNEEWFEWAVSATASLAVMLRRQGLHVRVRHDEIRHEHRSDISLLEQLAMLDQQDEVVLREALAGAGDGQDLVVAVVHPPLEPVMAELLAVDHRSVRVLWYADRAGQDCRLAIERGWTVLGRTGPGIDLDAAWQASMSRAHKAGR